jgi:carotenoid cleavage dioxygenase-like enzyme
MSGTHTAATAVWEVTAGAAAAAASQVSNERYKRHTFDGDGMVLSFSFDQGRVWFKNKLVRTKGFVDEQVRGGCRHLVVNFTTLTYTRFMLQGFG